jgi:glc operon protein GlcG
MFTIERVSAQEATKLINYAVLEAEKLNKGIAIAVAGTEGELIAFLRMDGANPASSLIAQNKAYTAARDTKDTMVMGKYMRDTNSPPAFWGDLHITGFGGGVTIVHNNKVIGGLGISGLSQEEDIRIAKAAIAAVFGA